MPVSEATFRQLSLEDDDVTWELVCGRLRKKPLMTHEHGDVGHYLGVLLTIAPPRSRYRVSTNHARLRLPDGQWYVPDVAVIPYELKEPFRRDPRALEEYSDPLPLVAEVWSPSTGKYDAREKLEGYRQRGDLEIWLVHPFDLTVQVHHREADGSYAVSEHASPDVVVPMSLPGVRIELATLFS